MCSISASKDLIIRCNSSVASSTSTAPILCQISAGRDPSFSELSVPGRDPSFHTTHTYFPPFFLPPSTTIYGKFCQSSKMAHTHIEFYDMRLAMQTNFSDTESIDSDCDNQPSMTAMDDESSNTLERWENRKERKRDNNAPSSIAEAMFSISTTQETKRRKVNGSSKPVKMFDTGAANKSKTKKVTSTANTTKREVQVYSPSGRLAHSFATCSEAARRLNIGRSRITRAIEKGLTIDGMTYKHPDPPMPSLPDVEMDLDEE